MVVTLPAQARATVLEIVRFGLFPSRPTFWPLSRLVTCTSERLVSKDFVLRDELFNLVAGSCKVAARLCRSITASGQLARRMNSCSRSNQNVDAAETSAPGSLFWSMVSLFRCFKRRPRSLTSIYAEQTLHGLGLGLRPAMDTCDLNLLI